MVMVCFQFSHLFVVYFTYSFHTENIRAYIGLNYCAVMVMLRRNRH